MVPSDKQDVAHAFDDGRHRCAVACPLVSGLPECCPMLGIDRHDTRTGGASNIYQQTVSLDDRRTARSEIAKIDLSTAGSVLPVERALP